MWCLNCSAELDMLAKYCFECGKPTSTKCQYCLKILVKPDAKFCSDCGKSQGEMLQQVKKLKTEQTDSYKSLHGPSARMFHPYNGRQDFATSQTTKDLMNAKLSMTPKLLREMEEFAKNHPNMTDLELQQEFNK